MYKQGLIAIARLSVLADIKLALQGINMILESRETKSGTDFKAWREELNEQKVKYPLTFNTSGEEILLQYAIQGELGAMGAAIANSDVIWMVMKSSNECSGVGDFVENIPDDVRAAIQKMLDTPGPYLLDVMVPHQEPVFPMMPSGGVFDDILADME
ncbi:hypothetical protein H0E87_025634 [Populus deltoides]|uniref:Uncharacterized protein n=1 Tax=Populus deltoides TaxID=3696 RepID=A0A8T2X0N6_POPDE|nr:hypothetical protein H0E87_025634 [Populus deltoides]